MATGFFGKLPARGDFVARGLPPGARPVVDRWLTRVLAPFARQPDDWPETGLRAIIAHDGGLFALLVLPSRDTSGRAFPLAGICWTGSSGQAQIDAWADAILPALTAARRGDLDADELIAHLQDHGLPAGEPSLSPPLIWAAGIAPTDPAAFLQQMDQP